MTHQQFLDEPVTAVRWMLEIHRLKQRAARERRDQERTQELM